MGFLSNLFGKKEPEFEMSPTATMLNEDRYWKLIDVARQRAAGDADEQVGILATLLDPLEPADLVGFRLRTDKLLYDTYTSKMWCAGYIMNGGCSDDSFEYFRLWVISRGREVYENAKADPDTLAAVVDAEGEVQEFYDLESLWYAANDAFEKKTGKDLYEYVDESFEFREGKYPEFDFDWDEEDPESMKALCPRLFERFQDRI